MPEEGIGGGAQDNPAALRDTGVGVTEGADAAATLGATASAEGATAGATASAEGAIEDATQDAAQDATASEEDTTNEAAAKAIIERALRAFLTVDSIASLQAGVDAAASGDTINLSTAFAAELATATAPVAITIPNNKSLTINASAASALTIGGSAAMRHFTFTNSGTGTVTLVGFTLDGTTSAPGLAGTGGIGLGTTGSFIIKDSTFTAIAAGNQGALTGGTTVRVENCVFAENLSRAIISPNGANYTLESCTFVGNTNEVTHFDQAGAIYFSGSGESVVNNCYFSENVLIANGRSQYARGAAIYADGGGATLTITNSVFTENAVIGTIGEHRVNNCIDGGALYYNGGGLGADAFLSIEDSTFAFNFAQDDGGALCIEGGQFGNEYMHSTVRNCTFTGNTIAGAQYGKYVVIFGLAIEAWITDGCGGAIDYYGLTNSEVTHSTFYNNGITDQPIDRETSLGVVGGGGAIGVDTGEGIDRPDMLPKAPTLTNNIFVGNYTTNPADDATIASINSQTSNSLGNTRERSKTGNVFVLPSTDRDIAQSADPRGLSNNGNIGYDNGNNSGTNSYGQYYTNEGVTLPAGADPNSGGIPVAVPGTNPATTVKIPINPETVFADTTGNGATAVPNPKYYGALVGAQLPGGDASEYTSQRFCYVPSPLSDELYRDGSGPYYDALTTRDTLGYQRDIYPNAGAVEIYWTKFNPGVAQGGEWVSGAVPSGAIRSLIDPNMFYLVTTPPPAGGSGSPGSVITFPRSSFALSNSVLNNPSDDYYLDYGFQGWQSNQPDTPGGSVFTPVQTNITVVSGKQTFTAIWEKNAFRVDWNQNYSGAALLDPTLHVAKNATVQPLTKPPTRNGFVLSGWYKDAGTTSANAWNFATDTITADMVLYAKWTPLYKISYDANGGAAPSFASKQLIAGETYGAHPTTVRDNHGFLGWYTAAAGGSKVEPTTTVTVAANHTLYAQWVQIFTVRFVDYSGVLLKEERVSAGANAVPPANPSRTSYTFGGWNGSYTNGVIFSLTQDLSQPLVLVDFWTLIMLALVVAETICLLLSVRRSADDTGTGTSGGAQREGFAV